jgi:ParB-like chromosome segregation protein Spo0J
MARTITRYESVAVDSLVRYPGNARIHNLAAIKESLLANGQYRPLVVQRGSRYVLSGNGTLEVVQSLGWENVDVWWVDVDDDTAGRIVLVDNRTNDLGTYDEAALVKLLKPYEGDLNGTAFDMDYYEDLLARSGTAVLPPEPFQGGFAESQADTERRRNTGTALASQGFKEVILVLNVGQLDAFQSHVAHLMDRWGTDSTTETVLKALDLVREYEG